MLQLKNRWNEYNKTKELHCASKYLISVCKQVKDWLSQNVLINLMINFTAQKREYWHKTFVMLSRFWPLRGIVRIPLFKGGEVNFDYLPQRENLKNLKKGSGSMVQGQAFLKGGLTLFLFNFLKVYHFYI